MINVKALMMAIFASLWTYFVLIKGGVPTGSRGLSYLLYSACLLIPLFCVWVCFSLLISVAIEIDRNICIKKSFLGIKWQVEIPFNLVERTAITRDGETFMDSSSSMLSIVLKNGRKITVLYDSNLENLQGLKNQIDNEFLRG